MREGIEVDVKAGTIVITNWHAEKEDDGQGHSGFSFHAEKAVWKRTGKVLSCRAFDKHGTALDNAVEAHAKGNPGPSASDIADEKGDREYHRRAQEGQIRRRK